jgi:hypothetical protein
MDKQTARALGLGAALYFLHKNTYQIKLLYALSDRFVDYILTGDWPKEAVDQIGNKEEEGAKEGSHATF